MPSEEKFIERLGEIPVLNDGWTSALDYYSKLKDFNSMTRFTLAVAECSMKKAAEISNPVTTQYQLKVDIVNDYACNKLDVLESKYPIIKQPSADLKDACLEYVQPVVDRVKPVVACMQNVVDTSKKQVNNMKETSIKLVTDARDLGVGTVTGVATKTLDTPPGRLLTRTVDGALTMADNLVDKYILPDKENESIDAQNGAQDNGADFDDEMPQMEIMEPSPERVVVHFRTVGTKLRKRMFQRATRDYQGAKEKTIHALMKLHSTVDLIGYATTHIGTARGKVEDLFKKIAEKEEPKEWDDAKSVANVEDRIISLGRVLMHQVRTGVDTLEKVSEEGGQFVRHPISKSTEYKELLVQFTSTHSLSDVTQPSLESIRSNLDYVRKNLQEMIDNIQSADWLTLKIEVDSFGLEEEDMVNVSLDAPEVVGNHIQA